MFSQVSFTDYVQTILYILPLYYGYVLYVYYRKDIKAILSGSRGNYSSAIAKKVRVNDDNSVDFQRTGATGHYTSVVKSLKNELTAFISAAGLNSFDKQDIHASLQLLIEKYSSVAASPYRSDIQQLIIDECKSHCSVSFSEAELEALWKS